MKKLACITLIFLTGFLQAQNNMHRKSVENSPEKRAEVQLEKLTTELDLNKEQQQQLKQLFAEEAKKRNSIKQSRKAASTERKTLSEAQKQDMRKNRADYQTEMASKMKDILDEKQYAKWEKINAENRANRKGQMQQRRMRQSATKMKAVTPASKQ